VLVPVTPKEVPDKSGNSQKHNSDSGQLGLL